MGNSLKEDKMALPKNPKDLQWGRTVSYDNTGGYRPPPPEFFHNISIPLIQPSELELRIRGEVVKNIETLMDELYKDGLYNREYHIALLTKVRDCVNLLWEKTNDHRM